MRKEKKTSRIRRVLKNRRSIAESLSALADAFLEESEPGMGTGLSAFLAKGEALPDLRLLGLLSVRRAQRGLESLIAAEEARRAARAALGEARREHNHAAALLRGNLRRLRDLSRGCFGRGIARLAPGGWAIPRSPAELPDFADAVGERLRDPAFTWPEGSPTRVAVEPGELAAEFEGPAGELRAVFRCHVFLGGETLSPPPAPSPTLPGPQ